MTNTGQVASVSSREHFTKDRELDRRTLLLHIAVARPRDAQELSRRIARPHQLIHEDLRTLISEGLVHIHESSLRTSAASRVIAAAEPAELRTVHDHVLADLTTRESVPPGSLVALAESGCVDDVLFHLLVRAAGENSDDPAILGALMAVGRARGVDDDALQLTRAFAAAERGRTEQTLSLTDPLLTSPSSDVSARAAILAGGAHIQEGRLSRASRLFHYVGRDRVLHDGVWAVITAVGQGDLNDARAWRAAVGDNTLTSEAAGLVDMADGLLRSVHGSGEGSLEILARSVSTLIPLGSQISLPESPAALAALVAIGRGEPTTAEILLNRALKAQLGGEPTQRRHLILLGWALMALGRIEAASSTLDTVDSVSELRARDLFLYWSLQAGIARRRTDLSGMRDAWREVRGHTFGMELTLYDLLPLGEILVVATRLRDAHRVRDLVDQVLKVVDNLANPIAWSAPLHWQGVQAAFQAEDPSALIPHANALVEGGHRSMYAATLAKAGQTWLEVLRGESDFASVESTARALANSGHVWDAARLAGQIALQHPEREGALSMMQLAREISKDQLAESRSAPQSSILTAREEEVARLVLEGQGYRAIGEQLYISPKTVEHHVARIRSRLGASSRAELLEQLHDILSGLERRA